jgi:DeoR/GlpR family transcriptional regulator of sugar metabolism
MVISKTAPSLATTQKPQRTKQTTLPAAVRQQRIFELVRQDGYVRVSELAKHFGISQMSARRDLDSLSRQGLIQRSQGAAVALSAEAASSGNSGLSDADMRELQYETRRRRQIAAKQSIARAAAVLLSSDDNIALDVGS